MKITSTFLCVLLVLLYVSSNSLLAQLNTRNGWVAPLSEPGLEVLQKLSQMRTEISLRLEITAEQ